MHNLKLVLLLSLLINVFFTLVPFTASARWSELKDADRVVNFERVQYKVRKDGSYVMQVERQIEILKESGREQGLARFYHDPAAGSIRGLSAKTINADKTLKVPAQDIETKPLASAGPGFDTLNQITIAFPDVAIGSKLYYRYEEDLKHPRVPGLFYYHVPFGWYEYLQSYELSFDSEIPLYFEVHDPEKSFSVQHTPKSLRVKLTKPLWKFPQEEEHMAMDNRSIAWVGVTTAKDWSQIPKPTVMAYENEIGAALPPRFNAILEKAKKETTDVGQINAVTSGLADAVRYVGDWRPIRGAFHPRALAKIAESGFGDCKDYTVSTGAMLRRLGFDVHAAWVMRGKDVVLSPLKISAPDLNHAIVYATKGGKEYWLDPTNLTSFGQGLYTDIADRPAIVLLPTGAVLKQIPPLEAKDSSVATVYDLNFDLSAKDPSVKAKGQLTFAGRSAVSMTGAGLSSDKRATDYAIITWVSNVNNLKSWKVGDYDLRSRIVKDLTTTFDYEEFWRPLATSAGQGYMVPAPAYANFFRLPMSDRVTGVLLDEPTQWKRELRMTGEKVSLTQPVNCAGESKWADYSRQLFMKSGMLHLVDTMTLRKNKVEVKELKTPEFLGFQKKILGCMQDMVVVFK